MIIFIVIALIFVTIFLFRKKTLARKHVFWIALGLGILLLLISLFIASFGYFDIDKCLDSGGRWNSDASQCEY
ncbi:hypothetical protein IDAT_07860 [Pseudidiomarina atlantica]|uniref:Uncharacterized protein n=1 Tax=Pseudidiomarina atlantica TaxID=1517416 RepID=A0A094INE7_9GAMM|nr:hypothetical protein IDAT_07860 [Pseudidiomarina atlantica]